jgi:hypothetical protein
VDDRLRPQFKRIWFAGGGAVSGECLRLGLADEVYYSILPILIGDGIAFFEKLDKDVALHLAEVTAYKNGMVELRYEVRRGAKTSWYVTDCHLTSACGGRRCAPPLMLGVGRTEAPVSNFHGPIRQPRTACEQGRPGRTAR